MFRIKRLYLFILQTFLPLFLMTFFICLFIVLMQFLWAHINDLVGKGLEIEVICELFFYAALSMVPLALPLSILLASLMVFGNLGERLELTAMKAAGVSLLRIMAPLIIFLSFVSVGAFFFQNNVLPKSQVKMWTLLYSMRQKSPELDIPEGAFYDQVAGYNIFVQRKNHDTGMLYNMLIYDVSQGYGTANIISADSGKLSFAEDQKHLFLKLYQGESFEDLKDSRSVTTNRGMLYRRESFDTKEILIPFDANFNRMDDGVMRNQYIGKDMTELRATIDSINHRIDSIGAGYGQQLQSIAFMGVERCRYVDRGGVRTSEINPPIHLEKPLNVDSMLNGGPIADRRKVVSGAISKANRMIQEYDYRGVVMAEERKSMRRHDVELQKKFTLAFACLIFFFIGAPLGSIIRKGGIAVPIVVSVLFFVVYYIINNSGESLAKNGIWKVWQGMWLSSAVLLPIGIFFTYKAINDSAVFNADAYRNFFRKLIGAHIVRKIELKEVIMDDVEVSQAIESVERVKSEAAAFVSRHKKRQSYVEYWLTGYPISETSSLSNSVEALVEYLSNSRSTLIVNKLMDFPVLRRMLLYCPGRVKALGWVFMILFPIGVPVYFIGTNQQKYLKQEINTIEVVCGELQKMLATDTVDK